MAKNPAVLFYTSDFLTGVIGFSFEEIGQYIYLLSLQHQQGHLGKEFIKSIIPNISPKVLAKFSEDKNGLIFNKRMEEERKKREKYSESRSKNRAKGIEKKEKNENDICKTYDKDMNNISKTYEKHMENENDNDNENISLFNYIESNFKRTLNSIEYEVISNWEDSELTRYAIKQAVLNQAYSVKYIDTILENYKLKGIQNVVEAQKADKEFQKKKNQKQEIKQRKVPDWVGKEIKEEYLSDEELEQFEKKIRGEK